MEIINILACQSIQTVFSQVTDFQIHKLEPLSSAISNHNPLLEGHPLSPDVKKNLTNLTDEELSGKILLFNLNMCHHGIGGQFTKKAQQLVMCLRGTEQKILDDFTYI